MQSESQARRPGSVARIMAFLQGGFGVPVAIEMLLPAVALGGCMGLPTAQPQPVSLFVLEPAPVAAVTRAKHDLVLEVSGPRAWPGFDTAQMAYVQRPYALDYFAASSWADTPSRMLAPLFVQTLRQSGAFRAIVQAPGSVPADLRLTLELVRLQQNFQTRPSRIELSVQAQLIDLRSKHVLATRTFDESEPAPTDDAYGGVTSANIALRRILQQVTDFCIAESGNR